MSTLRNSVRLIGHLGANPEIKNFNSGNKAATLRLATTEKFKSGNEWKEDTQWHRLVAWNKIAERAENQLAKGTYVLIEGKLVHRDYTDAKGEKKFITEVQVQNFLILDKKVVNQLEETEDTEKSAIPEEELPF